MPSARVLRTPRQEGEIGRPALCSGAVGRLKPPPPVAIALASGLLFALAAPPVNAIAALWVGMAGLAYALGFERPGRLSGGLRGLAFGFGANVVAFRFVAVTIERFTELPAAAAWLAVVLLSLAQGLAWAACGVLHDRLATRGVPRWAAFALGVYAATFVPQVFPWGPAGGATPWPSTVQLAEWIGERGVSALMALAAGLVAHALTAARLGRPRHEWLRLGVVGALLPFATAGYGVFRMARVATARAAFPTAKVALVQPAIAATERWDAERAPALLAQLTSLTRGAEARGADLTVWPEAAFPYPVAHGIRLSPIGREAILQDGVHGPVLAGLFMRAGHGESYNSAAIVTASGRMSESYDKRHLLWFGETVPLADRIPWIKRTFARGTGLSPGDKSVALASGPIRAAVLNCFEDTLPEATHEASEARPNLLVNVTNDAWFAGTAESELHLRLAVLRAVELRRDMVRAVNLGVTSWVDATGRVRARYDIAPGGTLLAEPALIEGAPTLYAQAGDAPWLLLVAGALLVHLSAERRRRASRRV